MVICIVCCKDIELFMEEFEFGGEAIFVGDFVVIVVVAPDVVDVVVDDVLICSNSV